MIIKSIFYFTLLYVVSPPLKKVLICVDQKIKMIYIYIVCCSLCLKTVKLLVSLSPSNSLLANQTWAKPRAGMRNPLFSFLQDYHHRNFTSRAHTASKKIFGMQTYLNLTRKTQLESMLKKKKKFVLRPVCSCAELQKVS